MIRQKTEQPTQAPTRAVTPLDTGPRQVGVKQDAQPHRPPRRLSIGNHAAEQPPPLKRVMMALFSEGARERDRGLAFLFLPVAMGVGAGLFFMAATEPSMIAIAVGFAASSLVAYLARENHPLAAHAIRLIAAMLIGALAAAVEVKQGPVLLDSDVATSVKGVVEAREFDAGGRVRYLIRLNQTADPEIRRPPQHVRLVARTSHQPVPVGAQIAGRARLSAPSGPVLPGGYDFAFRAFIDGIGAHGFFYRAPQHLTQTMVHARPFRQFELGIREMREGIAARIREVLPGDAGGIAAALAVSDRRGIAAPTVEALRATGLAHILAISGLHMALAAGLLYVGLRIVMAGFPALVEAWPVKKLAATGALLTASAYLVISGGSVPTQRAWIMLCIMLIAVLFDRPALTMRNVALAAMVIILISPSAVVGPGFQMSFAATAALIAAYAGLSRRHRLEPASTTKTGVLLGLVPNWLRFLGKAMLGLAITSLVAGLSTGLFSAHHFHRVAGNGLLANMLAMPLVTLVVMPAGLVSMLMMPFGLDALPLQVMGFGLNRVIAVAQYVDGLGGDVLVGQIPLHATTVAGMGLVGLVFLRSRLRYGGLVLIAVGALLASPPLASGGADVLISETGGLVGLAGNGRLASNAVRPSAFVFRQWQTALRGADHAPPVMHKPLAGGTQEPALILDPLVEAARKQPSRFHCAARGICAALHNQAAVIAINKADLIGPACDRADLVIVAIPVYMKTCRSGAVLVTTRSLRRTGSLGLRISVAPIANANAGSDAAAKSMLPEKIRPEFVIRAAVDGVVRPWTIQRYYDWRTRRYDVPS